MQNGVLAIPPERKLKPAFAMALAVHLALVGFLWIGVSWQSDTGDMVEAEVWDVKVREAAPLAAGERGAVAAPGENAMEAPPPPPPAAEKALPEEAPPANEPPDIALEQEKAEAKRKQAEALKAEQEKKKAEAEAAKRAKMLLDQEAKRIAAGGRSGSGGGGGGIGGGTGKGTGSGGTATKGPTGTGGSGTSPYSTGPGRADGGYIQKVAAKIKSNTAFSVPAGVTGNPPVVYDVKLLPDGSIRDIEKRKPSGVPGFDEAVLRAIQKSAPYPKDQSGRVPGGFTLTHRPKG